MLELKKAEPRCWILACLFCFKIFLSVKPLFCGVIIYLTCIVIHQTKPTSMGIHHVKGFEDTLTYKTYTRCLKCGTNFWTPCSTAVTERSSLNLTQHIKFNLRGLVLCTRDPFSRFMMLWATAACLMLHPFSLGGANWRKQEKDKSSMTPNRSPVARYCSYWI